jgi:hypothetical protein
VNDEWPEHFAVTCLENYLVGGIHAFARFRKVSLGLLRDFFLTRGWKNSHNYFASLGCPCTEHYHSCSTPGQWDHSVTEAASDKCCFYSAGAGNSRPAYYACHGHSTSCPPGFHSDSLVVDSRILEARCHNILWCRAGTDNDKFHNTDLLVDNTDAQIGHQNSDCLIDSPAGGHSNLDFLRDH